jgi:hypothetical protein
MAYVAAQDTSDGIAKVIYLSKDAKTTKTFDAPVSSTGQALDWPRKGRLDASTRPTGDSYPQ